MKLLLNLLLIKLMFFSMLACTDSFKTTQTVSNIAIIQTEDKAQNSISTDDAPCIHEVFVNDTKLVLNQTRYQDILDIYGPAPMMESYIEWPFYSICYRDKNNNYLFFTFNEIGQNLPQDDVMVNIGLSSLMSLSQEGDICFLTNKKIAKLNHHQLGENNLLHKNKLNYWRNIFEERPYCMKGENFSYHKNGLIQYIIFLSTFD